MPPSYPTYIEPLIVNRDFTGLIALLEDVNKDTSSSNFSFLKKATDAAEALGDLGDAQAVQPLLAALEATYRDAVKISFQSAVVKALGKLADPRAVQPLLNLLEFHCGLHVPSFRFCDEIAQALGSIGTPAVEPLLMFLKNKGALSEPAKSIWPWKAKAPPKVGETTMPIMYSVSALGLIGDKRAAQPISVILKKYSDSPGVESEARIALRKLGG